MNFIYHIGPQKTASTWFQNSVFPYVNDVTFVKGSNYPDFIKYVLHEDGFRFTEKKMISILAQIAKCSNNNKSILISEELFLGNFFYPSVCSPLEICNRINCTKSISENVKIVIVLRKQQDMIASLYKEYLKLGGCSSFKIYTQKDLLSKFLNMLEFDYYIKHYQANFGPENVYIGFFEELKNDRDLFLKNLLNFCTGNEYSKLSSHIPDLSVLDNQNRRNIGLSERFFSLSRFLNMFCYTTLNPSGIQIYHSKRLRKIDNSLKILRNGKTKINFREKCIEYALRYKESNWRLQELIPDVDIEKLGYLL